MRGGSKKSRTMRSNASSKRDATLRIAAEILIECVGDALEQNEHQMAELLTPQLIARCTAAAIRTVWEWSDLPQTMNKIMRDHTALECLLGSATRDILCIAWEFLQEAKAELHVVRGNDTLEKLVACALQEAMQFSW